MSKIEIIKASTLKQKPQDENKLNFGRIFTDHMFVADYTEGIGWHDLKVMPYGDFKMDPAAMVLHYAQEIFEGTKCYRDVNGGFNLFRPKDNFRRLNKSAERMCMANIDVDLCMNGLMALLELDKEWTPHIDGTSLYIRPTMIATDAYLGVKASATYKFFIILSPVGAYYANGLAPVNIYVEDEYVRSVKGGTGTAKTGGNYASSILAGNLAKKKGFDQVLWLDGVEHKYVEEVGSMNMMFVYGNDTIVTPKLSGSILEGITRDSVLKLAEKMQYKISEKRISIQDILHDVKNGTLTEAFGTGTAAVISPVKSFTFEGKKYQIGDGSIGKISQKMYDTVTGIQYGRIKDDMNWITKL